MLYTPVSPSVPEVQGVYANGGGVRGVGGVCMVECALYFVVLCSFVFTCAKTGASSEKANPTKITAMRLIKQSLIAARM